MLTIGDIATVFDGPHATPTKTDSGPYFLSISSLENGKLDLSKSAHINDEDFAKWTRRVTPEPGDILFSYETRLGEVAMMPHGITACLGRRMGLLRPDRSKVLPEYLLYAYQSKQFQEVIRANTIHGATVDRIALKSLPKFPIQVPELAKQQAIVDILQGYDRKLVLNSELNQTLEEMAQAIFKSWFVDFDPVKAKMNGQQPVGMDDATAALFPDKLVDSELGLIPEGWKIGDLSDLMDFNPKRTLKKGTVAPYLDMKNMPTSGHLALDIYDREMGSGTKFMNGDSLLARITPCLENGKTAYVDFLEDEQVGWGSTEYIVMRSKSDSYKYFSYYMARFEPFRKFAIQSMTGTSGRQRAQAQTLQTMPFAIPPISILEKFNELVAPNMQMIKSRGSENKQLSELRDTLLPKLLSGELSLDQAQDLAEVSP